MPTSRVGPPRSLPRRLRGSGGAAGDCAATSPRWVLAAPATAAVSHVGVSSGHPVACCLDILPAINDQDSYRSPGGTVSRFALHRQGQSSHVCTRWRAMACRGSLLVLPHRAGLGYRPTERDVSPSTDRRKGFLPALSDGVCTSGDVR